MSSKETRTGASCWLWWRGGREVMVWKKRSSYGWGFVWGGRVEGVAGDTGFGGPRG